jgi:hypothetical protein
MVGANHVIRAGIFSPEKNASVKLVSGEGNAKVAFGSLVCGTEAIATFYTKSAKEGAKIAPK